MACGNPVLSIEKPNNGERRRLEALVMIFRSLLFATALLLGLAFAVACYAELLGVVRFE
jgi:hypothetical protein